ncbi:hypothetical protein ABZ543_13220 [Streptomyces roseifaciens]
MAAIQFQGNALSLRVHEVMQYPVLEVRPGGVLRLGVAAVWHVEERRLAWIETNRGVFRLGELLYPWAVEVEDRMAVALGHHDVGFPCEVTFQKSLKAVEIEVFPEAFAPVVAEAV